MTPLPLLRLLPFVTVLVAALPGQDWSDDQLVNESKGFQSLSLATQIEQVGSLVAAKAQAFSAIVARIHGDHREYRLKVDRLLEELCDPNWRVRENAERSLVEIGGRARVVIQQRRDDYQVLEQHIRCGRILEALDAKGTEQEDRERLLLQGLVRTSLHLQGDERLLRSLRRPAHPMERRPRRRGPRLTHFTRRPDYDDRNDPDERDEPDADHRDDWRD